MAEGNDTSETKGTQGTPSPPERAGISHVIQRVKESRVGALYLTPVQKVSSAFCLIAGTVADLSARLFPNLLEILIGAAFAGLLVSASLITLKKMVDWAKLGATFSSVALIIFLMIRTLQIFSPDQNISQNIPLLSEIQKSLEGLPQATEAIERSAQSMERGAQALERSAKKLEDIQVVNTPTTSTPTTSLLEALQTGNVKVLDNLSAQGLSLESLSQALRTEDTAKKFFEATIEDHDARAWFKSRLDDGISADLIVKQLNGQSMGLLVSAYRAKNFWAMTELLDAGANPHAYEDLQFYPHATPFFVAPLYVISRSEGFTPEEKKSIFVRMINNGVVVPDLVGEPGDFYGGYWNRELASWAKRNADIELVQTKSACGKPAGLCSKPQYKDTPSCDFKNAIPETLDLDRAIGDAFDKIYVKGLIGVYNGNSYYIANSPYYSSQTSVLVRSRDEITWRVFKYSEEISGPKSLCWEKTGEINERCWISAKVPFNEDMKSLGYGGSLYFC